METKFSLFPINIEPMEEGGYFAECTTLQGCHAEGETFAKAIENIQDVINVHIQCRKEKGEIIPEITVKRPSDFRINLPLPIFEYAKVSRSHI